jgi:hypothetical protein
MHFAGRPELLPDGQRVALALRRKGHFFGADLGGGTRHPFGYSSFGTAGLSGCSPKAFPKVNRVTFARLIQPTIYSDPVTDAWRDNETWLSKSLLAGRIVFEQAGGACPRRDRYWTPTLEHLVCGTTDEAAPSESLKTLYADARSSLFFSIGT